MRPKLSWRRSFSVGNPPRSLKRNYAGTFRPFGWGKVTLSWKPISGPADIPTAHEDLAALQHFCYEFEQMCAMPGAMQRVDVLGEGDVYVACLESMLIHARSLISFLLGKENRQLQNAILPSRFVRNWKAPKSDASARLRKYEPVISQQLAHLTIERTTSGEIGDYHLVQLVPDLVETLEAFVEYLKVGDSWASNQVGNRLAHAKSIVVLH